MCPRWWALRWPASTAQPPQRPLRPPDVWPPAALEFLRELEANNDRDWFKANRLRYEDSLLAPARELAERLSHLGKPHFFRPYNNLRFRPGPPIKENMAVAIGYGGAGGFYF